VIPEPVHLQILPLVLTVGVETEIRVVPSRAEDRLPAGEYACELQHRAQPGATRAVTAERSDDGRVRFRLVVEQPGELTVTLVFPCERRRGCGSIYAVEPDLGGLIPLRGDLHTHTWYSDGSCAPGELLQTAWGLGLDFVAVTDHDNWEGSREAVVAGRSLPVTVIPGEEVAFNRGHVVAVGVSSGVMDRRRSVDSEAEVAALAETLCEGGEEAGFASQYARALWATRTIRALGGLSILAHPFWVADGELHLDERIARRLYLDGEIDAVELLGDVDFEDNLRSIALHTEMAGAGVRMPVVGNSDTHGLYHTLGRYWTVAFATANEPDAVLDAVRRGRTVACVQLPGEQLRIYGPLRLVHYAYFLHRRYFPTQDRLHDTGDLEPVVVYRDAALGR